MKKLFALFLAVIMAVSFAACSIENTNGEPLIIQGELTSGKANEPEATAPETNAPEVSVPETTEPEPIAPIVDVDKTLFNVELTIPADYIEEDVTQESLDADAAESNFKSATLNADGSVTYIMSKDQHSKMMDEMKANIDASLAEYIGSEDTPTITAIEPNDDYTDFKVTLSTDTVGLSESFSALAFMIFGAMYNVFNGTETEDISVSFISQATGEVLNTSNFADIGE